MPWFKTALTMECIRPLSGRSQSWIAGWPKRAKRSESQPRVSNYHPETTLACSEAAMPAADRSCHGLRVHKTALRPLSECQILATL
eukprot:342897-Chlamydomonas_euryale.AAC.1